MRQGRKRSFGFIAMTFHDVQLNPLKKGAGFLSRLFYFPYKPVMCLTVYMHSKLDMFVKPQTKKNFHNNISFIKTSNTTFQHLQRLLHILKIPNVQKCPWTYWDPSTGCEHAKGWNENKSVCSWGVKGQETILKILDEENKSDEGLQNKPGRGEKSPVSKVEKLIISKSIRQRGFSTRKLAQRLTSQGYPVWKTTVQKYLKNTLNLIPNKPQLQLKLTKKQKLAEWIFPEESKMEIWWLKTGSVLWWKPIWTITSTNRQKDRVCARSKDDDESPSFTVTRPEKFKFGQWWPIRQCPNFIFFPKKRPYTLTTISTKVWINRFCQPSIVQLKPDLFIKEMMCEGSFKRINFLNVQLTRLDFCKLFCLLKQIMTKAS